MRHPTTPLRAAAGTPPDGPVLRIVKGDATPEEVAALVAVLAARPAATAPAPATRSAWARPRPRAALPAPGPGAWSLSGRDASGAR
jgi:hypothetical protein